MTISPNMKETKGRVHRHAWESEMGYSWGSGGGVAKGRKCTHRAPGPGSTMSAESDIRFTRRKLSRPCRGCCAALAAFLVFLLLAAVAVYLAHLYLFRDPLNRQTFRGSFEVGEAWAAEAGEGAGGEGAGGEARLLEVRGALSRLYRASELRAAFSHADALALDSANKGTRVHFEVVFEPIFTPIETSEVRAVLQREFAAPTILTNVTLLPNTLYIQESSVMPEPEDDKEEQEAVASVVIAETVSEKETEQRECTSTSLSLCQHLQYNMTSFPNLVGHNSKEHLLKDLVAFRELFDAECSHLAADFVCQLLQPQCTDGRIVPPCKAYCRNFHAGCGSRLPERLRGFFDCARFPDYFGEGSCNPEPDCRVGLERAALSRRLCDGWADCARGEDERGCAHCPPEALRCARHVRCLPRHLRCDGTPDCPDGSDEANCLWIGSSLEAWQRESFESTLGGIRGPKGFAMWSQKGATGKICAPQAPHSTNRTALMRLGTALCRAHTYKDASHVEVVEDPEADEQSQYVEVEMSPAREVTLVASECLERRVLALSCNNIECGMAVGRGRGVGGGGSGEGGLGKVARAGDWPWQAALLRGHVHACDAALLHPSWLLTTAACFQGQPKAEWTARLGTVRIHSTSPWQQERRIVGMVKSPVEGSTLALVRLEEPLVMTDLVRVACLGSAPPGPLTTCNALGWTRNRDQLQRIHLVPSPMHKCENVSIASVNGICAETLYEQDDCDEEEYAGSSMVCFEEETQRWSIVGVTNWRIACTKIGLGRPRIYDSISSNIDWIKKTMGDPLT